MLFRVDTVCGTLMVGAVLAGSEIAHRKLPLTFGSSVLG